MFLTNFIRVASHIILLIILLSCSSTSFNDVLKSKDKGTAKTYSLNVQQCWEISKKVFRWVGTDAIEEHKDEGYMLTTANQGELSDVIGAWVEKVDASNTKVTVVTKPRGWGAFQVLDEKTFHKRFGQAVEIIKSGKPLPQFPPEY